MPYLKYDTTGLYSLTDAAKITGIDRTVFWQMVRERNLLESPETRVGHREFYNEEQLKRVKKQVEELKNSEVN